MTCIFLFSFDINWQCSTGHWEPWRFPDNDSGWGMQQLEHADRTWALQPPSSCQTCTGTGAAPPTSPLCLCHRGGSSPQAKNPRRKGPSLRRYMENGLRALSFGLFALPCPSQGRARTAGVFRDGLSVFSRPVLVLLSLRKKRLWFRAIKYQQFPASSQVSVPNKETCHLGSCQSLSTPSPLPRQGFETANSGYEQLLEPVLLWADEELISSISWFK